MNWYKIGSYIWTSCGAAWLVMSWLMGEPVLLIPVAGCIALSFVWGWVGENL